MDCLNILEARNHKSGNLEIRVPILGNHLFCAWLWFYFYGNIGQGLAAFAVRSSLYKYPCRNYDSAYTKMNSKSDFHVLDRWWTSLQIIIQLRRGRTTSPVFSEPWFQWYRAILILLDYNRLIRSMLVKVGVAKAEC